MLAPEYTKFLIRNQEKYELEHEQYQGLYPMCSIRLCQNQSSEIV